MRKKFSVVVIFDSNIIFGLSVSKEVRECVRLLKSEQKVDGEYYVPETVLEEAKKHLIDEYIKALGGYKNSIKTLSVVFPKRTFDEVSISEVKIEKMVERAFDRLGIRVLETPNDRIDWSHLRRSAIFQKPPFSSGESEKGFKDALIAQTILLALPRFKSKKVAIICHDGLLSEFLNEKLRKRKSVSVYPSIPDFQSALRLLLLGSKLIDELTQQAELAFYDPQDYRLPQDERKSLFYREDIQGRLVKEFPSLFANPDVIPDLFSYYGASLWNYQTPSKWAPVGAGKFRASKPVFVERSGNGSYIWRSAVLYRQTFENVATSSSLMYVGFSHRGEQLLEFQIEWESVVDQHARINPTQCKIKGITHIPRPAPISVVGSAVVGSSMVSGATLAGQGTIPIVPPVSGHVEITEPILGIGDNHDANDKETD